MTAPTKRRRIWTIVGVAVGIFVLLALVGRCGGGDTQSTTSTTTVTQTVTATPQASAQQPTETVTVTAPVPTVTVTESALPGTGVPETQPPLPDPNIGSPSVPGESSVYYSSCADARAAGAAPLYRGDPGYSGDLDRDGDGVACDT